LQSFECLVGTNVGEVGHALLLDEVALAREPPHQAHDDPLEQPLQLVAGGGARFVKEWLVSRAAIDAVEHQAMQVDVQIGRRVKALDQSDRTGLSCAPFQSRPLEQKARDEPMHNA